MGLSNDERGWVMTCLSGIACVLGASIICVDILVRQFPGKKNFKIQDSDSFLSASLSMSFGVMLFSALYNMLPSAKRSLQEGGFTANHAAWILIGCFLGGVVGIQIVSRILHHFMPSHVVDCGHSHDEGVPKENDHAHPNGHSHSHSHVPEARPLHRPRKSSLPGHMHQADSERRPPSRRTSYFSAAPSAPYAPTAESEGVSLTVPQSQPAPVKRPSLQQRLTSTLTQFTSGQRAECDCNGPCYGFSEPCGPDCFKNVNARGGHRVPHPTFPSQSTRPTMSKSTTLAPVLPTSESTPLLQNISEEPSSRFLLRHAPDTAMESPQRDAESDQDHSGSGATDIEDDAHTVHKTQPTETNSSHNPDHHHHHVPTNAFLSIGLQTSIAIALHKLPEGFITYATNHANPRLGVSVFLALFVHNITEGFAMALPLYLALQSRITAMAASFVLGGLSQPIGAGIAALWFKVADWKGDKWAPSEAVYGGMFAVTAGIMASVALQLFSESLDLTHSRTLCMVGAFTGMGVLGISSALTA